MPNCIIERPQQDIDMNCSSQMQLYSWISNKFLPSNIWMSVLPNHLPPRSASMPILHDICIQPIHKLKKNKITYPLLSDHPLPYIQLHSIRDNQGELSEDKSRIIQRSISKKLQGRYETIDRWREKYIPQSSVLIIKHKIQKQKLLPKLVTSSKQALLNSPSSVSLELNKDRLPLIVSKTVKNMDINIPDQRQLSHRLEMQLMTRLQKNKRYYKRDSSMENMNIFQQQNLNQQIKNKRMKLDLQHKDTAMTYKKLKIQRSNQLNMLNKAVNNQKDSSIFMPNPQQFKKQLFQVGRVKKLASIVQLKQNLLNEAIEETPQGWEIQNEMIPFVEEVNQ